MRTFIAIEFNNDVQQHLSRLVNLYQRCGLTDIRWTPVKNIHLTLRFLGDSSPAQLSSLKPVLLDITAACLTNDIYLTGNGVFPNPKRPRILWAGVNLPPELSRMQQQIELACRKAGFSPEERPFSPHLTLGRFAEFSQAENTARLAKVWNEVKNSAALHYRVEKITLFKSDLRPTGAVYSALEHFPLKMI
ncbi:MAG: RNA 2',3'-cyclic phosphodiesterase [Anaerolineae bacterium]|nr:RNA 2',3'-cyclic phosphodiesterase [Anaerolineae bacterium]